ncbi:hypothetical protein [Ammoniphilus sp. YIM 78166]|uniref:RCC1 domain-containing protein n=1 Tax=Ammoniphilus sp. YIM 78166 TaxID=1644106 RepID=UPI00142FA634|nr:hypothetical protein [Ammoniphilus sp. YIM 78166]
MAEKKPFSWGMNNEGQLGDGTRISKNVPVRVATPPGPAIPTAEKGVAAGRRHSLFLEERSVFASGDNSRGQLGNGTFTDAVIPTPVEGLTDPIGIAAGDLFSAAMTLTEQVFTWGDNSNGQLGGGTFGGSRPIPAPVLGLAGVREIAAGGNHILARMRDNTVRAWGQNDKGQLGDGTNVDKPLPVPVQNVPEEPEEPEEQELASVIAAVNGLTDVVAIAAGKNHSLALLRSGEVVAWGDNSRGQLGVAAPTPDSNLPLAVEGIEDAIAIAAGDFHSFAILRDGTVRSWGANGKGQLGDGSTMDRFAPVKVAGISNVKRIAGGGAHSIATLDNGTFMSWGANENGQLGNGTNRDSAVPVRVAGIVDDPVIAAGEAHSLAIAISISELPGPECIRVQKVYDWVYLTNRYQNKIQLSEACRPIIEERLALGHRLTARCTTNPDQFLPVFPLLPKPQPTPTPMVCTGARCDFDVDAAMRVSCTAPDGTLVRLNAIPFLFTVCVRVDLVDTDADGEVICSENVFVQFDEEVALCWERGLNIQCRILDVLCNASFRQMGAGAFMEPGIFLTVNVCKEIQVEAEVKLELLARFFQPRGPVECEAAPVEAVCPPLPSNLFPAQCPSIFPNNG